MFYNCDIAFVDVQQHYFSLLSDTEEPINLHYINLSL